MLTKVQAMVSLVAGGYVQRVHLVSGRREGTLSQVLLGLGENKGTVIECEGQRQERN
jgi:hypothetical protein